MSAVGVERVHRAVRAAPQLLLRQLGKPALDEVQPARQGRREVQPKAGVRGKPFLDRRGLMRRAVAKHNVDVEVVGHLAVDPLQKFLEVDRAVARVQGADVLAGRDVQRRVQAMTCRALIVVRGALRGPRGASPGSVSSGLGAWIWDFSSTHSTTARSGGLRLLPNTSRTVSITAGPWTTCTSLGGGAATRTPARSARPPTATGPPPWPSSGVDQCVASLGVVSSVLTITSSTLSSVTVRGVLAAAHRSGRPCHDRQTAATSRLARVIPSSAAISVFFRPSAASNTIRARCANA